MSWREGSFLQLLLFVCPRSAVSTYLLLRGNSVVEEGGGNFQKGVVVVLMVLKVVIRAKKRLCNVAYRMYL